MPRPTGGGGPPNAKWRQRQTNSRQHRSGSNSTVDSRQSMGSRSSSIYERQPTPLNLIDRVPVEFTPEPVPEEEEQGTLSRTYSGSDPMRSKSKTLSGSKTLLESAKSNGSADRSTQTEAQADRRSSQTPPGSSRKAAPRPVLPLREEDGKQHGHMAVEAARQTPAFSPPSATLGGTPLNTERAKRAHEEVIDEPRKNPNSPEAVISSPTSPNTPPGTKKRDSKAATRLPSEKEETQNPSVVPGSSGSSSSGDKSVSPETAKRMARSPSPEMDDERIADIRDHSESRTVRRGSSASIGKSPSGLSGKETVSAKRSLTEEKEMDDSSDDETPTTIRRHGAAPSAGHTVVGVQRAIKTIQPVKRVTFASQPASREQTVEPDEPAPVARGPSPKQPKRPPPTRPSDQRPAAQNHALSRKQPTPRRHYSRVPGEIRRLQATTGLLMQKAPFAHLIREMILKHTKKKDLRVKASALMALQEAAEYYLVRFLGDCGLCAKHAGRVTIMPKDCELVRTLRGDRL